MKDSVLEAKRRGEVVGSAVRDERDERPLIKIKSSSSSRVVMKRAQISNSGPSGVLASQQPMCEQCSDSDMDYDEASASKENDPSQSPSPVMAQSPRKPTLAKRPLSDLPAPPEPDSEDDGATALSPSERNIVANTPYISSLLGTTSEESLRQNLKLTERSKIIKSTRGLQDVSRDGVGNVHFDINVDAEVEEPPAQKRLCVWAEKENSTGVNMANPQSWLSAAAARSVPGVSGAASTSSVPPLRPNFHKPVSGSSMVSKNAMRSRMGLRRL